MFPVECVVRGYLSGSGWVDYKKTGSVCGIPLPAGLQESDRLPEPIFTPSTKAETGHDQNIPFSEVVNLVGAKRAEELKEKTLEVYRMAAEYARPRGIILADTKLEWGARPEGGPLVLADEVPRPTPRLAGGRPSPGRRSPTTSNTCATPADLDWNRTALGPVLPPKVARRRRGSTARFTNASPDASGGPRTHEPSRVRRQEGPHLDGERLRLPHHEGRHRSASRVPGRMRRAGPFGASRARCRARARRARPGTWLPRDHLRRRHGGAPRRGGRGQDDAARDRRTARERSVARRRRALREWSRCRPACPWRPSPSMARGTPGSSPSRSSAHRTSESPPTCSG